MIDFGPLQEDIVETIASQVTRELVLSARHDAWQHAEAWLAGLTVQREGDEIVVRLKGNVPNFIEKGLGPGGLGTEGPFDMRAKTLKGRPYRAIPLPGGIRMMSAKGAPWIHPGFRRANILGKLVENMDYVLEQAAKLGKWWRYDDGSWRTPWR